MRLQQLRTLPIVKLKHEVSFSNLRKKWRFCAIFFSVRVSQKVFDLSNTTVDTALSSGRAQGMRLYPRMGSFIPTPQ